MDCSPSGSQAISEDPLIPLSVFSNSIFKISEILFISFSILEPLVPQSQIQCMLCPMTVSTLTYEQSAMI